MITNGLRYLGKCAKVGVKIIVVIAILLVALFIVGSVLSNRYCYTKAANNLGFTAKNSNEGYQAIWTYIDDNLVAGMKEEEVQAILCKISRIKVIDKKEGTIQIAQQEKKVTTTDTLIEFFCCVPMRIIITYTQDGGLYKYHIETD